MQLFLRTLQLFIPSNRVQNLEAFHIIRSVVVEEMLHLCLVANVINAVGGSVGTTLTDSDFVPQYPTHLPTGETDFTVSLQKFSIDAIDTFLNIERSKEVKEDAPLVLPRPETKPVVANSRS